MTLPELLNQRDVGLTAIGGQSIVFLDPADLPGWWHIAIFDKKAQTLTTSRLPQAASRVPIFLDECDVGPTEFKFRVAQPKAGNPWNEIESNPPKAPSVYFIQSTTGGPIKIGWAVDVQRRLLSLQVGSPVPLRTLATIPGAGQAEEADLHRQFAALRLHGKWFLPNQDLTDFIARNGVPA